jgi:DNA-binding NarL/FixJ family response regulator
MKKTRIVVAEDYTVVREGLCCLLKTYPEFEVVGDTGDGFELLELAETQSPDLILTGLAMPKLSGTDAIRLIKKRFSSIKIVVLTFHSSEEHLIESFRVGADGYILKRASRNELETGIKSVMNGNHFVSPGITREVINAYLENQDIPEHDPWKKLLTNREKTTLKLVAEGYTSKEIAQMLSISVRTAEKHRANLMNKLGIHSIAGLTSFAISKGLINQ